MTVGKKKDLKLDDGSIIDGEVIQTIKDDFSVIINDSDEVIIEFFRCLDKMIPNFLDYKINEAIDFVDMFTKIVQKDKCKVLKYFIDELNIDDKICWTTTKEKTRDIILMLGLRGNKIPLDSFNYAVEEKIKNNEFDDWNFKRLLTECIVKKNLTSEKTQIQFVKNLIEFGVEVDRNMLNMTEEGYQKYLKAKDEWQKEKIQMIASVLNETDKTIKMKI